MQNKRIKSVMVVLIAVSLFAITACEGSGENPIGGVETPIAISTLEPDSGIDDTAWKESVAAYRAFYEREIKDNEFINQYIYDLQLLDLNLDGIPELTVYTNGNPASNAGAVFTYEDDEVRYFTILEDSIFNKVEMNKSVNAVMDLLGVNVIYLPIEEQYEKNGVNIYKSFLTLIDKENGEQTVFLCSSGGDQFCKFGTWYQFGTRDGYLYVEELMSHRIEFDTTDFIPSKVIECKLNGVDVTREEHDKAVDEMYQKMNNEYIFDTTVDYVAGTAEVSDWESFFNKAIAEGSSLLVREAGDMPEPTSKPTSEVSLYPDTEAETAL